MKGMTKATYRIIRIVRKGQPDKYVGKAWNQIALLAVTTEPQDSYTDARRVLGDIATKKRFSLKYFDGEHTFNAPADAVIENGVLA